MHFERQFPTLTVNFKLIMWHTNIPVKTEQILCLQAWEYVQVAHGSSHFFK